MARPEEGIKATETKSEGVAVHTDFKQTLEKALEDQVISREELEQIMQKYDTEKSSLLEQSRKQLDFLIDKSSFIILKNGFTFNKADDIRAYVKLYTRAFNGIVPVAADLSRIMQQMIGNGMITTEKAADLRKDFKLTDAPIAAPAAPAKSEAPKSRDFNREQLQLELTSAKEELAKLKSESHSEISKELTQRAETLKKAEEKVAKLEKKLGIKEPAKEIAKKTPEKKSETKSFVVTLTGSNKVNIAPFWNSKDNDDKSTVREIVGDGRLLIDFTDKDSKDLADKKAIYEAALESKSDSEKAKKDYMTALETSIKKATGEEKKTLQTRLDALSPKVAPVQPLKVEEGKTEKTPTDSENRAKELGINEAPIHSLETQLSNNKSLKVLKKDPKFVEALSALLNEKYEEGDKYDQYKTLVEELQGNLGFKKGAGLDGDFGKKTLKALQDYLKTGKKLETSKKLGGTSEKKSETQPEKKVTPKKPKKRALKAPKPVAEKTEKAASEISVDDLKGIKIEVNIPGTNVFFGTTDGKNWYVSRYDSYYGKWKGEGLSKDFGKKFHEQLDDYWSMGTINQVVSIAEGIYNANTPNDQIQVIINNTNNGVDAWVANGSGGNKEKIGNKIWGARSWETPISQAEIIERNSARFGGPK